MYNNYLSSCRLYSENKILVPEATIVAKASDRTSTGSIFSKYDENNKKVLTYYGLMVAGAVARSASATAVHPLNV